MIAFGEEAGLAFEKWPRSSPKTARECKRTTLKWIINCILFKSLNGTPGWLSQLSIRFLILASSHDLRVMRSSPELGSALGVEPA